MIQIEVVLYYNYADFAISDSYSVKIMWLLNTRLLRHDNPAGMAGAQANARTLLSLSYVSHAAGLLPVFLKPGGRSPLLARRGVSERTPFPASADGGW
jgi:hypothetical protein